MLVNRTPALLALCAVFLLAGAAALFVGCQRSPVPPNPAAQAESDNAQLREALESTGKRIEDLATQVERQQSREAEKAGDPPVVRDLAVARAALTEAQKIAAQGKDATAMAASLAQLRRVLQSIAAEVPASVIVQHADRAVYSMRATLAVGSKQFADASIELVAAYDAANHGRPVELVPAVTSDLESALKSLKKGDADGTIKTLASVIARALESPALHVLARAQTEIAGAEAALGREAWPVVGAELAQLESLLSQIVVAQPTPEKAETPAQPTEQQTPPTTGAAPAPAQGTTPAGPAPPPAAAPTTGAPAAASAVPVQPAAPAAAPATPTR